MLITVIIIFVVILLAFLARSLLRLSQTEARLWEKEDELDSVNKQVTALYREAARATRPARLRLAGAMSAEQIEQTLRGTKDSPLVKAFEAHVSAKLVEASDTATDRPAVLIATPERVILPYTMEDRLHDSGKASALADLLSFIQEATKSEEEPTEKPRVA